MNPQKLRPQVTNFYNQQVMEMQELNRQMKTIRRIQSNAHILHKVTTDPTIVERKYEAIVLTEPESINEKVTVYIEKLEWMTQAYLSEKYKKYDTFYCKLYVFEKEEQMRKKIRIQEITE